MRYDHLIPMSIVPFWAVQHKAAEHLSQARSTYHIYICIHFQRITPGLDYKHDS